MSNYSEFLESYLQFYYSFYSYMDDDPIFQSTDEDIQENPIAKGI